MKIFATKKAQVKPELFCHAEDGSRTHKVLLPHGPEPCASANSATSASCLFRPDTNSKEFISVREMGLEPTRAYTHKILSLACLPIPALPQHEIYNSIVFFYLAIVFLKFFQVFLFFLFFLQNSKTDTANFFTVSVSYSSIAPD